MKRKKANSVKRGILIALCVLLSVILVAMIAVTVYVESLMNKINRDTVGESLSASEIQEILAQDDEPTGTGPAVRPEDVVIETTPAEIIDSGENMINILLIGQDRRPGEKRQRSDAMILCTINKTEKTVTLTSFLRDIYINIPNFGREKLNTAYVVGGMEMLDSALRENFGIQIDANIEVDFNGFMKLVDMVGGVDIELTKDEANHMNYKGNQDVEPHKVWSLKEGVNTLTGSQALAYSRIRYIGTDFARTERQRKVLTSLFEKTKGMSVLELNKLLNEAVTLVTTDMSNSEITNYALDLFPLLTGLAMETQRIPLDNTYYFELIEGVGDCIIMDFETNRQFLQDTLSE